MKTRIATILLAATFLLAFSPAPSYGQGYVPTPVTVSKEKVKINGKTFYSHVVLEKQTLYSISKAYQVSVDDIYAANPTLHQTGLQGDAGLVHFQLLGDHGFDGVENHGDSS